MKIATVTLNPAIDQTVRVDNFRLNRVNRALAIKFDASGKGLSLADCGRLATAFSMGAITHLSYNLPPRDILWQYFHQVYVRKY